MNKSKYKTKRLSLSLSISLSDNRERPGDSKKSCPTYSNSLFPCICCGISIYSGFIAPVGQASAHVPQSVHISGSIE
ncbi:MAG: hypothetical protein LBK58_09970 [Prevotellaceae bacterium]|nr:hypothetical protein [Prevotellaceae bacterium]